MTEEAPNRHPARSVAGATLEAKAGSTSGLNSWFTKPITRLGIPSIMLTGGPHGVRKQYEGGDHLGVTDSIPTTCFPPVVALGCSFDAPLLERIGRALGSEARAEQVGVLLGPGINIKRSPPSHGKRRQRASCCCRTTASCRRHSDCGVDADRAGSQLR
ncbi:hypothetical protein ACIBED_20705 [Rhodococcus coprophilus]|uniref:hypothetical protein n=1 Tax=Rhodococcus coprophilus TaxID=38310 RepID=UPI00378D6068